jgi:penicillin G amidase
LLLKAFVALAILLAIAAGAAWWITGRDVPALAGQRNVAGLGAPVEVLFDALAIPHVYARDERDIWLAAGYLHGRERLWQMEVYRRAAAGRLSEMFGEETLPLDRTFLRLGLRRQATAEWKAVGGAVRNALEQYAAGVNAAMGEATGLRLPLEFRLVGVRPDPWTPVDTISIAKLMAYRLTENHRGEVVRGLLVSRLGPSAALLMPDPPSWAPTITADNADGRVPGVAASGDRASNARVAYDVRSPDRDSGNVTRPILRAALRWLTATRAGGSNGWVVSGRRTATGRPLLANDPHLSIEMPSIWYEVHLVAGALDVQGVTIPGAPFVVIGHNRTIAWGITNAGADVEDFYLEQIDWARRRYLSGSGWVPLAVETIEVGVRGGRVERVELFSTVHGPVATEDEWADPMFTPARDARDPKARWLSLRRAVTASSPSGAAAGFYYVDRAASWQEFTSAVERVSEPSLSFVYADTSGAIGYAMSGRIPVRDGWDGGVPVSATSGLEWRGFLPSAMLPRMVNPASGAIVAANNEVDQVLRLTRDWVAPFRAIRIRELLGDRRGLDVEAFARIQTDITSRAADQLLRPVEAALASPRARPLDPGMRAVLDRLRLWDRRVDGRAAVTLYEAFEQALWARTFADEMEAPVFKRFYEYAARERFAGLYAIIDEPQSRWFDDILTVDRRETRDDIVIAAAADAITTLRRQFGSDEQQWGWDRLHAVRFDHPLGAGGRALAAWFSRGPFPIGGDDMTIDKTAVDRREPFTTIELPSYRVIIDVGGWDNSRGVITTGQSGHPRSPHYFDQNAAWRNGQYHPMPFSRSAVDAAKRARLLLVP